MQERKLSLGAAIKVARQNQQLTQTELSEELDISISELFLYKFFPKVYRAKLIKKAIAKMLELNLDAKSLLDKTIPYGEGESRYEDLVKYLNYANELQTKLKKNFN